MFLCYEYRSLLKTAIIYIIDSVLVQTPMKFYMPKTIEIFFLVIFILFVIFPVPVPSALAPWIDNPLGVAVLFILVVAMLFFTNPLLGVVFILVAYELVRRSSKVSHKSVPMMKYTPDERRRDREMRKQAMLAKKQQNHSQTGGAALIGGGELIGAKSLEEDLVVQYGVYESNPSIADNVKTSFNPVYDQTHFASPV